MPSMPNVILWPTPVAPDTDSDGVMDSNDDDIGDHADQNDTSDISLNTWVTGD